MQTLKDRKNAAADRFVCITSHNLIQSCAYGYVELISSTDSNWEECVLIVFNISLSDSDANNQWVLLSHSLISHLTTQSFFSLIYSI